DELGSRAERIQPLFITVDPERDTPDALQAYLDYDERFLGLTGSVEQVESAARAYKVFHRKVEDEGSAMPYLVDHTSIVYLMDRQGRFLEVFTHETAPAEMAAAIERHL
ncbi:MAG: SCO family protein, partial [Pseudomonadota bacterium]